MSRRVNDLMNNIHTFFYDYKNILVNNLFGTIDGGSGDISVMYSNILTFTYYIDLVTST